MWCVGCRSSLWVCGRKFEPAMMSRYLATQRLREEDRYRSILGDTKVCFVRVSRIEVVQRTMYCIII